MACASSIAAYALAIALACFRQTSAFVPPPADVRAGVSSSVDMHRREQPSLVGSRKRDRSVHRLSMLSDDGRRSNGMELLGGRDNASCSGASTRLEFSAGLGAAAAAAAAAAALVLGGATAGLADDTGAAVAEEVAPMVATDAAAPAPRAAAAGAETRPLRDLGFEVPYTGKSLPLSKFLGSRATLVVNPKIDDPESLHQMPGITKLASEYSKDGLNVLLFPTDQGTFEADEDRVVRIKFYQLYGFGQFPKAVVFDKVDIVGNTIHPFYRYLCRGLKNPNGIARITLNYEKFLLDKDGKVVRRYPRKLEAADFEEDIKALVAGNPLPPESRDYKLAWLKADQEAIKSEYAFKLGLNYYNN